MTAILDTIFNVDYWRTIQTRLGLIWLSCFKREDWNVKKLTMDKPSEDKHCYDVWNDTCQLIRFQRVTPGNSTSDPMKMLPPGKSPTCVHPFWFFFFPGIFPEIICYYEFTFGGLRGRDRMVVRFITTYAISVYHH